MPTKRKILVTNDDGIASPGLHALAAAMRRFGEVWVIAPERERGAVGHAITLHKPLRVHELSRRVLAVNGTPSDCVTLAVTHLLPSPPALILSGINRGVNLGDDVTYSGTVSAAFEGALLGVPSLAISQEVRRTYRVEAAAAYAARIVERVLRDGLPDETLLNINVPDRPAAKIAGVRLTSLGKRRFIDPVVEKADPRGRPYYWIAGRRVSLKRRSGSELSDHDAVRRGYVSVTPLHLDLTQYDLLQALRWWETC